MTKQNLPISSLETPAILVDMETLEGNIREMSQLAAEAGVKLRHHTKIHESPAIAKLQITSGACGIEVGTIDRAVCMAEAGITDILVAHPIETIVPLGHGAEHGHLAQAGKLGVA